MVKFVHLKGRSWYIDNPARAGLYQISDTEVILIDSGAAEPIGKRIHQRLQEKQWTIRFIINTHAHGDHLAGNRFLCKQYHCPVYAMPSEVPFGRFTELEVSQMYGGYPFDFPGKDYLQSLNSDIQPLDLKILPEGFEIRELPGHTNGSIAVKTPDDVWYLGDAVCGPRELSSHPITFIYNVGAFRNSLQTLRTLEGEWFVAAHTAPVQELSACIEATEAHVERNISILKEILQRPVTAEEAAARLFDRHELKLSVTDYMTYISTIRSYLSYLVESGFAYAKIADGYLVFGVKEDLRNDE